MTQSSSKILKLVTRLQLAKTDKRFYEAHQICKNIYFRCTVRKDYSEALLHLIPGCKFLLQNQQWESGVDLACLVVDIHSNNGTNISEQDFNCLCNLLSMMPSKCIDRDKFISKFSVLLTNDQPRLNVFNEFLGRQLWQEGSLSQARNRIIISNNGFTVGCFLIELHQRYGNASEVDLFVTQAVLQFLCIKQVSTAALTFYTYTRKHPKLEPGPPFLRFPLLNFVWLLMLSIERKLQLDTLSLLCTKYQTELTRDASYADYLEKISQVYFGVRPKQNPFHGLLSNLAKILGDNDENEDITHESTSFNMHVDEID